MSLSTTSRRCAPALLAAWLLVGGVGCSTSPEEQHQPAFIAEARAATAWFESNVRGLRPQLNSSAGYIVYPSVGQWGIIFGGGKFGRGMLNRPDGTQIGWAAVNTGSLGLQAGVREFNMLVVFQDEATLESFKANTLTGSVSGIVTVAEEGTATTASFSKGVAVYQGAATGLMAGVNIALDYMRYVPLGQGD